MYKFHEGYYADVRIEDRFNTIIRFTDGKLDEKKERGEKRAFVRVFDGKMWYYSSTTDVGKVQDKIDELCEKAKYNAKIDSNKIVKKFEVNSDVKMQFCADCVKNIDISEKIALIKSYLPELTFSKAASMPTAVYLDRYSVFEFYSSKGAYIKYDYQTAGFRLGVTLSDGEKRFSANFQRGDVKFSALKGLKRKIHDSVKEQIDFMENSVGVTAGEYPVILSPEAAGVFAHESFGHKSEADFMLADEGIKREWTIGKQVGSPILSIVDSGKILGCGYCPYDDEGTHARKNYVIKKGILTGRLHSAPTACALKEKLTGNARAINCTFEPIVRMTTTYIEKGDLSLKELFAGVKHGYYIKTIKHGSGMSKFTIAPHLAYEIENGEITRPVQISVITGDVFTTLGLIDGLSDKVELLSFVTGGCGKMEQQGLPVGFGGPHVRISKIFLQ